MKCGCRRRACARSISSRTAATARGSMPSLVSLRSATSCSIAPTSTAPSTLAEQLGLGLGLVAIPDRVHEEIAERVAFEQLAEHVEHPPASALARLGQLLQQAAIDFAPLACWTRRGSTSGRPRSGRCDGCGRTAAPVGSGSRAGRSLTIRCAPRCRFTPSPAASLAIITRTTGSLLNAAIAARRASRATPAVDHDHAGGIAETRP